MPSSEPGVTTSTALWYTRSFGPSSNRGVIGSIPLGSAELPLADVELAVEFERGLTLICSSSDAAVSSSGVHVGDTVGDADTDVRCCLDGPLCDCVSGARGCAGPGKVSAGMFASVIAGRKRPEGGGDGSCAFCGERAGRDDFGDEVMRLLGST